MAIGALELPNGRQSPNFADDHSSFPDLAQITKHQGDEKRHLTIGR